MRKSAAFVIAALMTLALSAAGCMGAPMAEVSDSVNVERPDGGGGSSEAGKLSPPMTPAPAPDAPGYANPGDRIVYTANASVETLDFDASVAAFEALVARLGGYIESSSVAGTPIRSYVSSDMAVYGSLRVGYRSAYYAARIPADEFGAAKDALADVGNVLSLSTSAENVAAQYSDDESRLSMYRAEETSLLSMLAKAETVGDMILVEQRLSDVRWNVERLTANLRVMDERVSFATLSVNITEVENLTNTAEPHRSYGRQIADGFMATLRGTGSFFAALLKYFVIALPALVVIAIVATFGWIAVNRLRRRGAKSDGDK